MTKIKKTKTTKAKKKKVPQIPLMTTKGLIREANHNTWEIIRILEKLQNDSRENLHEFMKLCMDLYAYADDLRIDAYNFLKQSSRPNADQLIKRMSGIYQFHKRLEMLEKMMRTDQRITPHERETNTNLN